MQAKQTVLPIGFLPNEIIFQILSYLVNDIENLKKPWSRTCRLFRIVMEENLKKYCEKNGFHYQLFKNEYNQLHKNFKRDMLPLPYFVECAVTRGLIHHMGRYQVFKNSNAYLYIPKSIYQLASFNSSWLPTKETLYMAMVIGNVPLCVSLINKSALREEAKHFIKNIMLGKGARFALKVKLQPYAEALPWNLLSRALIRSLLACYEKLSINNVDDMPSREAIIQCFIEKKEFMWAEQCIESWGVHVAIPFVAELLLFAPYVQKTTKSFSDWNQKLSPRLNEKAYQNIIKALLDSFLKNSTPHFTDYNANRVFAQLKEISLFNRWVPFSKDTVCFENQKEIWIQLEDILHTGNDYVHFLMQQGMKINPQSLLIMIENLEICTPLLRERVLQPLQSLLDYSISYLTFSDFREVLWDKFIKLGFITATVSSDGLALLNNKACEKKILAKLDHFEPIKFCFFTMLESSTLLQSVKDEAVLYRDEHTIYCLLRAGVKQWNANWDLLANILLENNDYQVETTFYLLQFLLDHQYIQPTFELLMQVINYRQRLLDFVYKKFTYIVKINLEDVIRFEWSLLNCLMGQNTLCLNVKNELYYQLKNSFKLFEDHTDPSKCDSLVPIRFCSLLKAKVLTLANELFLEKRYPYLLAQLTSVNEERYYVEKLLSLLSSKWWRIFINKHSGEIVPDSLHAACQLMVVYRIKNLTIIQPCLTALRNAFQWDSLQWLMEWKVEITGFQDQDKVLLESCFDEKGELLGPLGSQDFLNWKNKWTNPDNEPINIHQNKVMFPSFRVGW